MKERILMRMIYLKGQMDGSKKIIEEDSFLERFHSGKLAAMKSEYDFLEKLISEYGDGENGI